MKKLISVMLVLCMVLALVPAMAFAAVSPDAAVAMVGEGNYYADLQEAFNAAAAPGAATNRVDIVDDAKDVALVISGNVVLQLNGHTLTGTTGVLGVAASPVNVNVGATLTIQGPGTIECAGSVNTNAVLGNAGTLTLDKNVRITGAIVNTGALTVTTAYITGCVINTGTVTCNGGSLVADSANHPLFTGKGKVTINGGGYYGTLDDNATDKDSCAGLTVNGGAFKDAHVVKHTSAPIAGWCSTPSGPMSQDHPDTYRTYPLTGFFEEYWVGKATMEARANAEKKGTVVFLYGDVAINGVPTALSTTNPGKIYYYDGWDSYYTGTNTKALVAATDGSKYTGRGLVNGMSDFNVVASKATVLATDPIADGLLNQNADLVKSVSAKYTGTNKNEVFVQIDITVDLKKATPFTVPEVYRSWGNNNGSHKWVPIALDFLDLNGFNVHKGSGYEADKHWNLAFGYYPVDNADPDTTYIWVGVDHNDKGENASFDFCDLRYGDHGLIYRCTIVVHDTDISVPEVSHPDDEKNAETYPGDGKDKPATSAPAASGTGAGDGPAKTGDNSTVMLWATLLVASAAGVAICVVDEAKKRSRK